MSAFSGPEWSKGLYDLLARLDDARFTPSVPTYPTAIRTTLGAKAAAVVPFALSRGYAHHGAPRFMGQTEPSLDITSAGILHYRTLRDWMAHKAAAKRRKDSMPRSNPAPAKRPEDMTVRQLNAALDAVNTAIMLGHDTTAHLRWKMALVRESQQRHDAKWDRQVAARKAKAAKRKANPGGPSKAELQAVERALHEAEVQAAFRARTPAALQAAEERANALGVDFRVLYDQVNGTKPRGPVPSSVHAQSPQAWARYHAICARARRAEAYRPNPRKAKVNPGPSKAEQTALLHAYAIYTHAPKSGLSRKQQERLYNNYEKALRKVLNKLGAQVLSAENEHALDRAADTWWKSRPVSGAGVDW